MYILGSREVLEILNYKEETRMKYEKTNETKEMEYEYLKFAKLKATGCKIIGIEAEGCKYCIIQNETEYCDTIHLAKVGGSDIIRVYKTKDDETKILFSADKETLEYMAHMIDLLLED